MPEALASVRNFPIRGLYRLSLRAIDAYSAGGQCGAGAFKQNVYITAPKSVRVDGEKVKGNVACLPQLEIPPNIWNGGI